MGGGATPLAGSVCEAVDTLVAAAPGLTDVRILQLSSDGEENSTRGGPCEGLSSDDPDPPYTPGSWQNRVFNYVLDHNITVNVNLFDSSQVVGLLPTADPDAVATAAARLSATGAPGLLGPPTLTDFFTELARDSGGRLTVVSDQRTKLPVFADFTNHSCTDRSDAILVARAFGRTGAPQDNPFDLNSDGEVGFADYTLALGGFTPGGCGTPDLLAPRAPLACSGSQPVTIDGQVIEGSGITINATGICRITIKNSLIVSGESAIRVQNSAIITIDNSIVVGESAVLRTQGSTALSIANTVLHGPRITQGAFVFVDRGGNTLE